MEMPSEKRENQLIAEISLGDEAVKSIREFSIE